MSDLERATSNADATDARVVSIDDLGSPLPSFRSATNGGTDKPSEISAKISAMSIKQIEQREAHQRKKMTLFSRFGFAMLLVLCLILCLNSVATAVFINWGIPTTSDASGDLIVKGSNGTVAQVALAKQTMPLGLAQFLNEDELLSIDKVMVTRLDLDDEQNATVRKQVTYTILGFERDLDRGTVQFTTHDQGTIGIMDGQAWRIDPGEFALPVVLCATNAECAKFKSSGIDIDAVQARAAAANPEAHRRALAQAQHDGECSDPTKLVDMLKTQLEEEFAAEFEPDFAAQMERFAEEVMMAEPIDEAASGELAPDELADEHPLDEALDEAASNATGRQLRSYQGSNSISYWYLARHGIARTNEQWRSLAVPPATSSQCRTTKSEVDRLRTKFNSVVAQSQSLENQLKSAQDAIDDVYDLHGKLKTARDNFGTMDSIVRIIKCCGGPLKPAGNIADAAMRGVKHGVNSAWPKVDNVVQTKLKDQHGSWKIEKRVSDTRKANNDVRSKMEKADDTFEHYAYKVVLVADRYCSSYTSRYVCTSTVKNQLRQVNDAIDNFPPQVRVPNLQAWVDFIKRHRGLIGKLSMQAVVNFLRPIHSFLTKKRCFRFFGRRCFRIMDVFNNWLVRFVNGIINAFLRPLMRPLQRLFSGLSLPSLPGLSLPNPSMPAINFDFNAINVPCLNGNYNNHWESFGRTMRQSCFNFPTISTLQCPSPAF